MFIWIKQKNKKGKKLKKILLSGVVLSSLVMAAEPDLKKDDLLKTHTEFGYIETQGNTRTQTFNLESKVKKGWGKHIANLLFDGQYASDKNEEIKNKYLLELEYDYEFTDTLAFSYLVGYKQDRFSGYDYQFYTGPGAKYKAIKTDKHNLSLEGNILYSSDEIEDTKYTQNGQIIKYPNPDNLTTARTEKGYTDDYAAARAKLVYEWKILENLKFDQELSYRCDLGDIDTYFAFSKTALSTKFTDIFSAGVSYKVDYANNPATGKEYADRTFTANLIIDY